MFDFLQLPFFHRALAAGLVVGCACAFLGVLVVLKRVVFVGAALAEIASAGLAAGFWLGFASHAHAPVALAFCVTLAASLVFAYPSRNRVLPQESVIAIGFVVGSAMALVLVSESAQGVEELKHLLSGHLLTVEPRQVLVDALVFSALIVSYMIFRKKILYVSFDPETAQSSGLSPRRWNQFFYLILAMVIALGIRSAGTLLVVAYLVLPAAGALLATRRLALAQGVSVGIAALGTLCGLSASFIWDVPASATIVLALSILAAAGLVVGARRRE
jgi:ABC-type Mn2+/Zn2+ transport system permease subunit